MCVLFHIQQVTETQVIKALRGPSTACVNSGSVNVCFSQRHSIAIWGRSSLVISKFTHLPQCYHNLSHLVLKILEPLNKAFPYTGDINDHHLQDQTKKK